MASSPPSTKGITRGEVGEEGFHFIRTTKTGLICKNVFFNFHLFLDDAGEDKDMMERRVLAMSLEQEEEEVLLPAREEEMLKMAIAMSLEQEEEKKPSSTKGEPLRNAKQKG